MQELNNRGFWPQREGMVWGLYIFCSMFYKSKTTQKRSINFFKKR